MAKIAHPNRFVIFNYVYQRYHVLDPRMYEVLCWQFYILYVLMFFLIGRKATYLYSLPFQPD